jgi:hypothetical protein
MAPIVHIPAIMTTTVASPPPYRPDLHAMVFTPPPYRPDLHMASFPPPYRPDLYAAAPLRSRPVGFREHMSRDVTITTTIRSLRLDFSTLPLLDSADTTIISKLNENGLRMNRLCTDTECTICFDDVTATTGGSLVCGHSFHKHCITKWFLTKQFSCPNCRGDVDVLQML